METFPTHPNKGFGCPPLGGTSKQIAKLKWNWFKMPLSSGKPWNGNKDW